jgi:hypothetical protein
MCLNEMYSGIYKGKHLSDNFPIRNGLKRDALSALLVNLSLGYTIRKVQENQWETEIKWDTTASGLS